MPDAEATKHARPHVELVGRSDAMKTLLKQVNAVAKCDLPVVLRGESGTGKELVARTLHRFSRRASKPLVAVNCAVLPESLIESELFGHVRGAFTGAVKRMGRFQAANEGTLFLDEVAELSASAQAKLLRVLQEGVFEPVGTVVPMEVDVRVVCATHYSLEDLVQKSEFREDLFYRLNGACLTVPPLRQRMDDLELFVSQFLREFGYLGAALPLTESAWKAIREYPFPGNVRELKYAIQYALVMSLGGAIDIQHLPEAIQQTASQGKPSAHSDRGTKPRPLQKILQEVERQHIISVLRYCDGNRTRSASLLGISRKSLWEKMRGHHILPLEFSNPIV